jgi:ribonucleoside-diphosphate reductase alpha chain
LFKEYLEKGKNLDLFVGAYDVTPEEHIKVQATIQRYIDNAISKTINLPESSKWEDIAQVALQYAPYLKGLTVYRAGSKGMEPLQAIPLTQENIAQYAKPANAAETASAEVCRIGDNSCGS